MLQYWPLTNDLYYNKVSLRPTVPNHFYCGNRAESIQHARLRTHCSSLREHIFSKNIVLDPYCQCGEIETSEHYLLHCPLYAPQRQILLHDLSNITTITAQILLHGIDVSDTTTNSYIFTSVHKFITTTKRFSSN